MSFSDINEWSVRLRPAACNLLRGLILVHIATHMLMRVTSEAIWGCELEELPEGAVHMVVSTFNAEPEQLLPWMWHLGLTNAHIYVYYRHPDTSIARMYDGVVLPCNMTLHLVQLLPNKGREAAAYLHHIVQHFEALPDALYLVHDHGPASRHSLCGPFYRRVRAYYRGLADARNSSSPSAHSAYAKFSNLVVTLSSGCAEQWSHGCCSMFLCSLTDMCPFLANNCTHYWSKDQKISMHGNNNLYVERFENQLVGENGTMLPMALIRYAGAVHSGSHMWNISFDYPQGKAQLSAEETGAVLHDIMKRYHYKRNRLDTFKSCCGSMIVRRKQLQRWPLDMYREMLEFTLDEGMDYEATKAVSGSGWALWSDREYRQEDLLLYIRIDTGLKGIQGCPMRTPEVAALLHTLRKRQRRRRGLRGDVLLGGSGGRHGVSAGGGDGCGSVGVDGGGAGAEAG